MTTATRDTARWAGRLARDRIREQIPPPRGRGRFPGYAAKGRLQRAVVYQEPVRRPLAKDWEVRVGIRRDRRAAIYARIHERGGTIRPRSGKWLVFPLPPEPPRTSVRIPGRETRIFRGRDGRMWIMTTAVRIRRKEYFLTGWREAQAAIARELPDHFRREVRIRA